MGLYEKIARLPVEISGYTLEPCRQVVPGGWTRTTTVIRLMGGGFDGVGEDVTWNDADHERFQARSAELPLAGRWTIDGFSHALDGVEMFAEPAGRPDFELYRRWAFESAALDLALRQAATTLVDALGTSMSPLTFVLSTGLGDPPDTEPLERRLALYPDLRFKLDLSSGWTPELVDALAVLGVVDTVDLKGLYHGDFTGPPPDPDQYRMVAEKLTGAWIEDPAISPETLAALEPFRERITWDANIHSVADIVTLPFEPRCINVKPSRFGLLSELFRTYEYCQSQGIAMYGGGQFELGPGRGQAQYLASIFHPDGPNDICPLGYNEAELSASLPTSPLNPAPVAAGFRWDVTQDHPAR